MLAPSHSIPHEAGAGAHKAVSTALLDAAYRSLIPQQMQLPCASLQASSVAHPSIRKNKLGGVQKQNCGDLQVLVGEVTVGSVYFHLNRSELRAGK